MNEATPPWRSFSAGPPEPPPERSGTPTERGTRPWQRWLVPTLAVTGGLAAGALAVGLLLLAFLLSPPASEADFGEPLDAAPAAAALTAGAETTEQILVDVAGAVVRPGLHRLRAGDRVGDAIEAAGGFAPRADLDAASQALNLAHPLEDGAKVLVPQLGNDRLAAAAVAPDGRVDINRADQAELESLPGIGPVTAGKIIAARRERPFASVRELRTRGLVGESVFADIEGRVTAT